METRLLDPQACYQALLARDVRFDGRIFVGVATTGIYCRPICPARAPNPENCGFFPSAAAAELAGLRPCLRCRPELAPGNASVDAVGRLASAAASLIEDGALTDESVEAMAARLGVTGRHLRRAVEREYGVSPIALAQTQRLLTAKRLLTDTDMPVTEVAFASGFASLRRFNALFKERYRLNPTDLRRRAAGVRGSTLACEIAFRPPMDWEALLGFLAKRATPGVEVVSGGRYIRTLSIDGSRGWAAAVLSNRPNTLRIEMSESLAPKLIAVIAGFKRICDVTANPLLIQERLGELAAWRPGLRVPGAYDGFELAIRAILGQQVSVAAATTLSGRFARTFGVTLETPIPGLTHVMPGAIIVASLEPDAITALGILGTRARTITSLARAISEGRLVLNGGVEPQGLIEKLKSIPGIGEWTAQYIAMRALGWPDAFPHSDLGIMKAMGASDPRCALTQAEAWRPWRAYAAMHLWKKLEEQT